MKLIMKTEFDNLRLNSKHDYETDSNGDKQVVKIYCGPLLIAKKSNSINPFVFLAFQDMNNILPKKSINRLLLQHRL